MTRMRQQRTQRRTPHGIVGATRAVVLGGAVVGWLCACADGTPGDAAVDAAPTGDVVDLIGDDVSQYTLAAGPDGRVVYMRMIDGKSNIFVADSNGANRRRLTDGAWDLSPRWSPDGRWIAFGREVNGIDILVVPADSGEVRTLVSTPAVEQIVGWLPDNSGIVYLKFGARTELWTATLDGRTARLADEPGSVVEAAVSPDGQWVAASVLQDGRRTVRLHSLVARESRQLTTEGYESLGSPANSWSPDSRFLLYGSSRSGTADVWSIDITTGETRQLTRDVRDDFAGAFSPDGRQVAFLSDRGGQRDVWVVADTGGEPWRVTDDRTRETSVAWTRDGGSLLIDGSDAESHAYRVGIDDSVPVRIVNEATQESDVRLSKDGARIVFTARDGADLDIRTAPVAGGPSTLVAGGPADEWQPELSPDGERVVFASNRAGRADLWIAPTAGGEAVRLLDWPSREYLPRWSPDGQWIAFASTRETASDIWIVRPDGRDARRVTSSAVADIGIHWSHDSRLIAYTTITANGATVVRVVEVATGRSRDIADGLFLVGSFWPGDSLLTVARQDNGMARLELRRIADGALVRPLSPTDGLVYEAGGVPSPDGQWVALAQFTFQGNDYPLVIRRVDGTESRVLSPLRGNTASMAWLPDSRSLVFEAPGDLPRQYRKRFVPPAARPE